MIILFLSTIVPYPPQNGHAQRTYNLIREAAKNHEVHLVAFAQKPSEMQSVKQMRDVCASAQAFPVKHKVSKVNFAAGLFMNLFSGKPYECARYDNPDMREAIRTLTESVQFDILHCDTLVLAIYRNELPNVPMVMINHNVESILNRRRAEREEKLLARFYIGLQAKKLEKYEREICAESKGCVVVSEQDRASLMNIVPSCDPVVVSNGVDLEYFSPGEEEKVKSNSIVFCGGLYWAPNADGIHWFAIKILDRVREVVPDAALTIIGTDPPSKILDLHSPPTITVMGFLEDVRPVIREAACVVVPLLVGGGSRLKILDAFSMGKPVVSTSIGCEGLNVSNEKDILVCDTESAFAKGVVRILQDRDLAKALGGNGLKLVQQQYGWEKLGRGGEAARHAAPSGWPGQNRGGMPELDF